uniref:Uncharacterized protein n=1 Tax=Oryza rufipogon TaxID=4529 RepID=A0A0E0N7Z9_ORYRU
MAVAVAAATAAVSCPRLVPERIPLSASVAVTCGRGCGVAVRAHGQSATRRGEKLCDDHDGHGGCQCGGCEPKINKKAGPKAEAHGQLQPSKPPHQHNSPRGPEHIIAFAAKSQH